MKKIFFARIASAIFSLLAFATPAQADTVPGWYVGAGAGATFPGDARAQVGGVNNTISYDTGWDILGDIGYGWANGIRVEGELNGNRAETGRIGGGSGGVQGRLNNFDVMGNVYYD